MSTLLKDLINRLDLDPYCYKTYIFFVLFKHNFNSNRVSLSQAKLAKEIGISKKAIQRTLKCLEKEGLVTIQRNRGVNVPDGYIINI